MTSQTEKRSQSKELEEARILSAKDLGRKVRAIRKKNTSFTQEEVSLKIGTVQSAMSEIENGKYSPITLDLIGRIATILNTNPHELAAAYWGINQEQFTDRENELLSNIVSLVTDYLNEPDKELANLLAARHRRHIAQIEEAEILADMTPDVNPKESSNTPQNITPNATENS